VTFQPNCQAF